MNPGSFAASAIAAVPETLRWISSTPVAGPVHLDVPVHILAGAAVFLLARAAGWKSARAVAAVAGAALAKELFDAGVVYRNQFYFEPIKDIGVTVLPALLLTGWPVRGSRPRADQSARA